MGVWRLFEAGPRSPVGVELIGRNLAEQYLYVSIRSLSSPETFDQPIVIPHSGLISF